MVEVSLTVGKLDASLALLLTKDHHLIEFPTILLPNGVKAGSIVKIRCDRDSETEEKERKQFREIQDEILATYGKNLPQNPVLKTKNVTQTSCVLAWDPLDLGTATLKSLVLYKDGKKLGAIPNPLNNRTTKLSGLAIDKTINFQLRLDSTAGIFSSETIEVTTHKMTDLSGINVCLGDISTNDQFSIDDIQDTLKNMGAFYPASSKVSVETTHFIATRENKQNEEYLKANDMNIPVIRPEWLKACERERRIVGVRDFYVKDCVLPDIMSKNYWKNPKTASEPTEVAKTESVADNTTSNENGQVVETELTDDTRAVPEDLDAPVTNISEETTNHSDTEQKKDSLSVNDAIEPIAATDEIIQVSEGNTTTEDTGTTESEIKSAEAKTEVPKEVPAEAVEASNKPSPVEKEPETPSKITDAADFVAKDISLENVAAEEDGVNEEADQFETKANGKNVADVADVPKSTGTEEDDKEKSPDSLEDVEI